MANLQFRYVSESVTMPEQWPVASAVSLVFLAREAVKAEFD